MEWTNEITLQFLECYERETIIWDPSHNSHKNRNEVHDAWKPIQAEFAQQISIEDLKKKKDSLMATFRNCKTKLKNAMKSGAGTSDLYTPHWFAFSKMAGFLMAHDRPKRTINSETVELEDNDNDSTLESEVLLEEAATQQQNSTDGQVAVVAPEEKPPTPRVTKKRKLQTRDDIIYDRMENAYNLLKQQSKPQANAERNECAIFGELIGKRLEKMKPDERDEAMHAIENAIHQTKLRFAQNIYSNTTIPPTQTNPNSGQNSYCSTPSPAFSHNTSSQTSSQQYSELQTYSTDDYQNTRDCYENFS